MSRRSVFAVEDDCRARRRDGEGRRHFTPDPRPARRCTPAQKDLAKLEIGGSWSMVAFWSGCMGRVPALQRVTWLAVRTVACESAKASRRAKAVLERPMREIRLGLIKQPSGIGTSSWVSEA